MAKNNTWGLRNMENYWIQKQDALLRKYFEAWPNEKEFWFSNIVDELDEYQKHIDKK